MKKKTLTRIISLANNLAQCKLTNITDSKQKFALVRLMTNLLATLEKWDQTQNQAQKMFTDDKGNLDRISFSAFINEELNKEQEFNFDGISDETYEQLVSANDTLTIGQLSYLYELVKES